MQNNINIYGLLEWASGAGGHKSINTHTVLGEPLCEWRQDLEPGVVNYSCAGTEIHPKQSDAPVSYWNSDSIRERNYLLSVSQVL